MIKNNLALLTLCAAGAFAVYSPLMAQSTSTQTRHYRLTFVLSYADGQQPSQTIVLDVPVKQDQPGIAMSANASGLTGQPESNIQESLQCTDVRESATGLAANVAFSMDSMGKPFTGSKEAQHHNLTFNRQIDMVLGKPTRITEELHVIPLGKSGEAYAKTLPPAPQITVTAIQM